jgi:hypothetical protein
MRWDRLTLTALGGIAVLLMGIALLIETIESCSRRSSA